MAKPEGKSDAYTEITRIKRGLAGISGTPASGTAGGIESIMILKKAIDCQSDKDTTTPRWMKNQLKNETQFYVAASEAIDTNVALKAQWGDGPEGATALAVVFRQLAIESQSMDLIKPYIKSTSYAAPFTSARIKFDQYN